MPEWKAEIRRRLAALHLAPAREADIVEELAQHLEDRFGELRARGMTEDVAGRIALSELSDAELTQALTGVLHPAATQLPAAGSTGGVGWPGHLKQDLRYALRSLRLRPGFAFVAILTLALGIGANTAIFSVVHSVLLKSLPYPESDRLVTFWGTAPEKRLPVVNYPDGMFLYFHEHTRVFEKVAAYNGGGMSLVENGEAERINAAGVTADFFATMGYLPLLGRGFVAEDYTVGKNRVAVLSYALWVRRFGSDRSVIGRSITLGGQPDVVIGVMPAGLDFPTKAEVWIPQVLVPERTENWYLSTVGRLKPGQTARDARREVEAMSDEFMIARPDRFAGATRGGSRVVAMPLLAELVGDARTPLLVLLGAVGLVLLIASANIANLLLARAAARTREMAVRCCIGASPGRIASQLLTESALIAAAGAGAGLLLAVWGLGLLRGLPAGLMPRLNQVGLDPTVLLFTLGVTLFTGVLFGVAPALRASRVDLQEALREGGRGGTSAQSHRLSHAFVVSQFALSLILLIGAGLLLRSFQNTLAVDPGFRAEKVLTGRLQMWGDKYDDTGTKVRGFFTQLLRSLGAVPGVSAAGVTSRIPFSPGNPQQELYVEGQPPKRGDAVPVINNRSVTPGYFAAIGTPIIKGRGFLESDNESAPEVVIVDETVAQRYWPGEDPIGKRIKTGTDTASHWRTIVGLTPNVKHASLNERPNYEMYQPYSQFPDWSIYLVVRTAADPEALTATLRRQVAAIDPLLPLSEVKTMEQAVSASLSTPRVTNLLLAGFAVLALLLAAIGIYGVMSLAVAGRLSEFGVRLALGASPADVLRLVLRQGMTLALVGLGVGLVGAAALTRLLSGLLFGVQPLDPIIFLSVAGILAAVAGVACYLPARRATRADPITVLRRE